MDREHILQEVKHIVSEVTGVEESEIKLYAQLKEDLGIPALELAEIFTRIEQKFDISLPKDSVRTIEGVDQLIDRIEEEL